MKPKVLVTKIIPALGMENKVRNKQSGRYTTTEIHHSFSGTEGGGGPEILRRGLYYGIRRELH